jgi:hypothetical protein
LNAKYVIGEDTSVFVILLMDYFSCITALIFVFLIMIFVDFGKETRTDRMSEFKSIFKGSQIFLSSIWTNMYICRYIKLDSQVM